MTPPEDHHSGVTKTKIERAGPSFAPGTILAGRYKTVRFIAQGGMGEVYEVEDLKLGGHLALKTIRADLAAQGKGVERFLREIKLARTITHPNVSRIFDLDEHKIPPPEGSSAPPQELLFLTMELLTGETLSQRILRGRVPTEEAFDIVAQIAGGLDAAHAAGVIHRDFKSGNVMLEPPEGPAGKVRAVITDFGLARNADPDDALQSISETGIVVGTPAYMAPEQVEGKPLTSAADLYAFGIVMYEMVTGTRPFTGGSPMTVAVKRLHESPQPPRKLITDLDPVWNATILRCLEREPSDRFGSGAEIVESLREKGSSLSRTLAVRAIKRRGGFFTGLALAALLLGVGAFYLARSAGRAPSPAPGASPAPTAVAPRTSVAVVSLRNLTGRADVQWLSTAVTEMIGSDLGLGNTLRVLPGDAVSRARTDLSLNTEADVSGDDLARFAKSVGADRLVTGSFTALGARDSTLIRLELRLHDGRSGVIVAQGSSTGTEVQLFDLVSRASQPLKEALGVKSASAQQELEVAASLPSNPEAAKAYSEAVTRLRASDATGARELLEKAVAADPKHPLPHAALASALVALGYEAKAAEEAKKAVSLSDILPPSAKRDIEATYYQTAKEWPKAVDAAKELFKDAPDSVDLGLRLAQVEISADQEKEAVATLESLRKLPAPASADPRIDLAESRAYQYLGDSEKQRTYAEQAASKGTDRGMRSLVARARLLESVALYELGDNAHARTAAETGRDLAQAAGDRSVGARCLEQLARILSRSADYDGARRLEESALQIHKELGDLGSVARVLQNTGDTAFNQGKLTEAQRLYDASLAVCDQIGDKYQAAAALNNIGARLQHVGDLAGAQKRYQSALTLLGQMGQKSGTAITLTNLAEVMYTRGELKEAEETHREALAIRREIGDKEGEGYDLYRLALLLVVKGDLTAARDRFQEAIEILKKASDKLTAAQASVGLSRVALAEGKAKEAEGLAREAEEVLRTQGATDEATLAQIALVDALLLEKNGDEAKAAMAKAKASADVSEDKAVHLAAAIAQAKTEAASGKPQDVRAAVTLLDSTAATAAASEFVGTSLEARLAGAQAATVGALPSARGRSAALAQEARTKGYELISREAEALAAGRP